MPDTLQPDKKEEETLMLKVGDKCSVYYSYAKFLTDSVLEADKAAGASQEVINEHLQRYSSKTNAQVYKNYPAGKTTTLDGCFLHSSTVPTINSIFLKSSIVIVLSSFGSSFTSGFAGCNASTFF